MHPKLYFIFNTHVKLCRILLSNKLKTLKIIMQLGFSCKGDRVIGFLLLLLPCTILKMEKLDLNLKMEKHNSWVLWVLENKFLKLEVFDIFLLEGQQTFSKISDFRPLFRPLGTLETRVFRKIRDLIPFHVFLILFQFVSKYHNEPVYFSA